MIPKIVKLAMNKIETSFKDNDWLLPVKCKILDKKLSRTKPMEGYPNGQLGCKVKFTMKEIGEHNVFVPFLLCEDIMTPLGSHYAADFMGKLFKDDFQRVYRDSKE